MKRCPLNAPETNFGKPDGAIYRKCPLIEKEAMFAPLIHSRRCSDCDGVTPRAHHRRSIAEAAARFVRSPRLAAAFRVEPAAMLAKLRENAGDRHAGEILIKSVAHGAYTALEAEEMAKSAGLDVEAAR